MRRKGFTPLEIDDKIHNYYAVVDTDLCTGCEECVGACSLEAISISSQGVAEIDREVCVGCGVCATKCPAEALTLKERPGSEHYTPITQHPNIRSSKEFEADLEPYKDIIKPK